ncbi:MULTISPECIES: hypothetical protein [Asaia]|uniref:hypothetical protein n=1 Tax=Asaia TaxID=91914 RepID=UPI002FC2878C
MEVKPFCGHSLPMSDSNADTWFKLRLSPALRAFLEKQAADRGVTLTAEILRRIESTIDGAESRIEQLEKITDDEDYGNRQLWFALENLKNEISQVREKMITYAERAGVEDAKSWD